MNRCYMSQSSISLDFSYRMLQYASDDDELSLNDARIISTSFTSFINTSQLVQKIADRQLIEEVQAVVQNVHNNLIPSEDDELSKIKRLGQIKYYSGDDDSDESEEEINTAKPNPKKPIQRQNAVEEIQINLALPALL